MQYISTRGQDGPLGYEAALLSGLARDGGLFLPVEYPRFTVDEINILAGSRGKAFVGHFLQTVDCHKARLMPASSTF